MSSYSKGGEMSINLIVGNEEAKKAITNQLRMKKSSGTYLLYGKKGADLLEFALAFAKGLNCEELEFDYCGKCRVCENIDKEIYADLHIIRATEGSIKIDTIREVIKNASETSYEKGKKVFIIEDINKLRKEASNALLKIIEEPPRNTYFIMLSNSLNILPTIKSRSFIIEVAKLKAEELEVNQEIYDFFLGNVQDIKRFKEGNYVIEKKSFTECGIFLKDFIETGEFSSKIKLLSTLENFILEKKFINDIDKIVFSEVLDKAVGKNRELLEEILYILIVKSKNLKNLEKLLELKEMIRYNVNISLILLNFILYI